MAVSDDDVDQAFLFAERATTRKAITRKPLQLPISDTGWELVQTFALAFSILCQSTWTRSQS